MLYIINNSVCNYNIKNNKFLWSSYIQIQFYVIMIIKSAYDSERERNWIQGHWWQIDGIVIRLIHSEGWCLLKIFLQRGKLHT